MMNTFSSKATPLGRRVVSQQLAQWSRNSAYSFSSLIANNTRNNKTSDVLRASPFKFQTRLNSSLTEALSNEINEEDAEDEIDQDFLDTKKLTEKSFTIVDEEGNGTTYLKRQFKDETIEINFDCQDEAEIEMDEEAMENASTGGGDDEEEEPQTEYGINFQIKITKPSGDSMNIMCAASEKLIISSVRHIAAGKDAADQDLYGGPVFDHLDEKLQDAFYAYLSDRNIDEDLCYFIMSYSREKEQKEYQNWLQKLMKFSEK